MLKNLLISMTIAVVIALSLLAVNSLSGESSSATPAGSDSPAAEAGDNGVTSNSAFAPKSHRSIGLGNVARR